MSSPHAIEAGTSRARRVAAATVAALLLACVPATLGSGLASAQDELRESKRELRETNEKIRNRTKRIREIQRSMNRLVTRISLTEEEILAVEHRIATLEDKMVVLQARTDALEAQLAERAREAYMLGGVDVLYVLTATSAADAASRMGFLNEMNRRDAILAARVQETRERLARIEAEVVRARQIVELKKRRLEADKEEMQEKMAESRRLVARLHVKAEQIQVEISQIRPFAVCPLDGPHAIADDFGIMVQRSKARGGDHIHQGNDIYAATGTPIVAPFDGVAVDATNKLGGFAVTVYGEYGYVYNAHLSRFGTLGEVQRGDVIGYVGATGNAGGPHDHFEWHPDNGDAVDPHEFLMLVCDAPLMTF